MRTTKRGMLRMEPHHSRPYDLSPPLSTHRPKQIRLNSNPATHCMREWS